MLFTRLRRWATLIKKNVLMLWFACRDPRIPWWFKLLAFGLVAYALSPIDLIPDFIPVIGLLDDAIIIPLDVLILLRLLPRDVRISSARGNKGGQRLWPVFDGADLAGGAVLPCAALRNVRRACAYHPTSD
ncbi:YkvA family protein [Candidatus Pantoea persica]|uniref:YkvA family protein n=1 Tax=Candidatus Pantoea persica TaxID=2518128 RepID=UPI00215D818A|nr:YkvA family protein [Candidatus Pantoea persica]MBA2814829.1 putative membrane protein YkvA [Candidatus Pantoea persica]